LQSILYGIMLAESKGNVFLKDERDQLAAV